MNIQHKELAKGKWEEMPFLEQMANIGSEISRAINWRKKGNEEYAQKAFERSLELFDLSKDCKYNYPQYKELLRAREEWVDYFKYENTYNSSSERIIKYYNTLTIGNYNQNRNLRK